MWKQKLTNPSFLVPIVSLGSLATGSVLGYLIASKRLSAKYSLLADQEIAEVKSHYAIKSKEDVSLEDLASKYKTTLEDLQYVQIHSHLEPVLDDGSDEAKRLIEEGQALAEKIVVAEQELAHEEEVKNIFGSDDPETYFDFDEELERRSSKPNEPYVITHDEFFENATEHEQVTLTFYEGDGVLADDKDGVVDDEIGTVGSDNLLRFGHGSKDRNIVYVRNERLSIDLEVLRSDGKYAKEVLGFDELQHSHRPGLRRFRDYDE